MNSMNWSNAHVGTVNGIMLYALFERAKYNPMLQYRIGIIQTAILMNAVMCDYNGYRLMQNGVQLERGGMEIDMRMLKDNFVTEWSRDVK